MTEYLISLLSNWLVVACIYTLLGIGFSLLFGVLDVIHFSHGDVSFLSPFISLGLVGLLAGWFGGGLTSSALLAAILISIPCVGLIGMLVYMLVIRPFQASSQLIVLVATVAFGIVIRQSIRHIVPQGSTAQIFPNAIAGHTAFTLAGVPVSYFVVIAVITTAVLLVGMYLFLKKSLTGIRIRALAQDREVARLMAINTTRMELISIFLASVVGAVGGIFFALYTGAIRFDYGITASLLGFSTAVVGGLGSIYGAVVGGLILALVQTLSQAFLPFGTAYVDAIAFLVVIAFLVFRPTGVLGEKVVEKV